MTHSTRVAPKDGAKVPTPPYRNPPVHEVILDVQFTTGLDEKPLRELRDRLAKAFTKVEPLNVMQVQMTVGPGGQGFQTTATQFGGWSFTDSPGDWVLQTSALALTFHLVRPGPWPAGPYVGWSKIYERYFGVHEVVRDLYAPLVPKRAGLRYLNRIAVPLGQDISAWLEFKLQAPKLLHDLFTFNLRQTWARAGEHDDISATVGLAKIDIGDPTIAASNQGILLDIDLFNLWSEKAPSYERLPDWFDRAHQVENDIFESCITDALRERFNKP